MKTTLRQQKAITKYIDSGDRKRRTERTDCKEMFLQGKIRVGISHLKKKRVGGRRSKKENNKTWPINQAQA